MRCLGLTIERKRCAAEAVGVAGYCEQHRRGAAQIGQTAKRGQGTQWRVMRALKTLRDASARHMIPDDAEYDIPSSLKHGSTAAVIDELLHNSNSMMRWCAAFALRRRRDPAAIEPLWQALQRDQISLVRQQAAVALGKIGTPTVLGPLIEALWHDPDAGVRQACAIALGNLGHTIAATDLANVLERDQAVFVRWDCVLALGQVGDRAVEKRLSQVADRERSEVVRHACHEAIAAIRRRD